MTMEDSSWDELDLDKVEYIMCDGELCRIIDRGRDSNGVWFKVQPSTEGQRTFRYPTAMSTVEWVAPWTIKALVPYLPGTPGL